MPEAEATEALRAAIANALTGPTLLGKLEPGQAWQAGYPQPKAKPPQPTAVERAAAQAAKVAARRQPGAKRPSAAGQAPKTPAHALKTVGWPFPAPPRKTPPAPALDFLLGWLGGTAVTVLLAVLVGLLA